MTIFGYARVSTDGQSVDAQVKQLRAAGAAKTFRETASGAKTDRRELARALKALGEGDTLLVTRLDRLARSTRDLLNMLDTIAKAGAGFRSLGDTWADTTTPHGRLDAHRAWRACRVRARVDPRPHRRRPRARQGARRSHGATPCPHAPPARGSPRSHCQRHGLTGRLGAAVQCFAEHDFKT